MQSVERGMPCCLYTDGLIRHFALFGSLALQNVLGMPRTCSLHSNLY